MLKRTLILSTLFAFFLGLSQSVSAQKATFPGREIGLRFSSLDLSGSSFSAIYKKQIAENKYRRIRFAFGDISLGSTFIQNTDATTFNLSTGLAIGTEKRKSLAGKTSLFHGWDWNAGIGFGATNNAQSNYSFRANVGVGYVLGIQHDFNKHLAINIETIPGFGISYAHQENSAHSLSLNGSGSNLVALSVMYKFGS